MPVIEPENTVLPSWLMSQLGLAELQRAAFARKLGDGLLAALDLRQVDGAFGDIEFGIFRKLAGKRHRAAEDRGRAFEGVKAAEVSAPSPCLSSWPVPVKSPRKS